MSGQQQQPPPPPPNSQPLPPVVLFRFRGRAVVCAPFWTDAGEMLDLEFACPGCGQVMRTRAAGAVEPNGRLTVSAPVRCLSGCGLVLVIERGIAVGGGLADPGDRRLQC